MCLDPQDLKTIVSSVGKLIDARAKTTEINLQASITTQIKISETRLQGKIKEAKNELRGDAEAKTRIKSRYS